MTLIGDTITRCSQHPVYDPAQAELDTIRKSLVPTAEARAFFSRIAALVASASARPPRPLLFAGERGTGKTTLVRCLEGFLKDPQDPQWQGLLDPKAGPPAVGRGGKSLYVHVPEQPTIDLANWLIERLLGRQDPGPAAADASPADFAARFGKGAGDSTFRSVAVLALDGISRRVARLVDEIRIHREIEICRELAAALAGRGVLPIIIADEEQLRQGPSTSAPLANLKAHCDSLRLSRGQIEEVICSSLARKDGTQREEILKTLGHLRVRLPRFAPKPETFADLYPLHPQVYSILFPLRTVLQSFSPLGFAYNAIESACSRPSTHLITHEALFDFVLQELRGSAECGPILMSFDELCSTAVPRLGPALRDKARALLKAIALETICDTRHASVTTLANALLLYDEAQPLPAYSLTAALLMEIEEQGRTFLAGEGDGTERTYHLLGQQRHVAAPAASGQEPQKDEVRVRLAQLIYDWFRAEIPPWRPNPDPKYWRTSLSLLAPIPEGPKQRIGMVYFKNVLDPLWSRDDLQILHASPHPWILLVLSPFEHFYEFEAEIAAIAASSPKIMVWHPDAPSAVEADQLQRLAVEIPWPPESAETSRTMQAGHDTLTDLYVRRGKFITSQGQWSVGEGLRNLTLTRYLSDRLVALCIRSADVAAPGAEIHEEAVIDRHAEERHALNWAALLSGEEDMRHMDAPTAEARLLSWWASTQEIDASTLAAKLNPLPEILMTTSFWSEYRQFVRQLELLQPTFQLLHSRSISFSEAMSQVRLHFNRDEAVLRRWKALNLELAGLARWLPALEHMREYLLGAFLTSMEQVDTLRSGLLESINRPREFLSAGRRDAFDRSFLEFKTQYIDCYNAKHEEAMQIADPEKGSGLRIDPDSLRNLELLSRLQHSDRSHLNRVRVIARWLRGNQCSLPVRQILERSPRCFCNFDPATDPRLGAAADRVNTLVGQGLDYFRTAMNKCREQVIDELKGMRVDQSCARLIAPLLGSGDMLPLTPRAIEILNQVIERHPQPFMAAFLSRKA